MDDPFLSIIIPAHNEERRLPQTLGQIDRFLQGWRQPAEVIVVENGSTDRTADIVEAFARDHPYVRLIQTPRRGKGLAVRLGMLAARGRYRYICDADLSTPIEEVVKFLPPQLEGFDVAIGSREVAGARRIGEPLYRHVIGRLFNAIVRALAVPGFQDTQCGFKMFRAEVAEDLFRVQRLDGMSFDVEVLFIARMRRYRIVEVPVTWYFNPESRVRLFRDSLNMFRELLMIRWNAWKGYYGEAQSVSPSSADAR
ncbi:dolichyl-phosphate beta-glucosyltransferase [Thermoflexus sp.]|uniref:dolichyl-phosphate beta-glucosyltransferase n=1 Tax=Thermoflexus sp. TaxID=1969742 RepID=UPI0035E432B3